MRVSCLHFYFLAFVAVITAAFSFSAQANESMGFCNKVLVQLTINGEPVPILQSANKSNPKAIELELLDLIRFKPLDQIAAEFKLPHGAKLPAGNIVHLVEDAGLVRELHGFSDRASFYSENILKLTPLQMAQKLNIPAAQVYLELHELRLNPVSEMLRERGDEEMARIRGIVINELRKLSPHHSYEIWGDSLFELFNELNYLRVNDVTAPPMEAFGKVLGVSPDVLTYVSDVVGRNRANRRQQNPTDRHWYEPTIWKGQKRYPLDLMVELFARGYTKGEVAIFMLSIFSYEFVGPDVEPREISSYLNQIVPRELRGNFSKRDPLSIDEIIRAAETHEREKEDAAKIRYRAHRQARFENLALELIYVNIIDGKWRKIPEPEEIFRIFSEDELKNLFGDGTRIEWDLVYTVILDALNETNIVDHRFYEHRSRLIEALKRKINKYSSTTEEQNGGN